MSKKIRRNDPCPCGSGKKYKKCCMASGKYEKIVNSIGADMPTGIPPFIQTPVEDAPKTMEYMKTHNSSEVLNIIIALQLNPENRGANVRMERLARYAALTLYEGGLPVNYEEFVSILDEEFASDMSEDCPCNLHADTLTTIGGAHIIFPGIACHSAEILQTMCDAIYMGRATWPNKFTETILPAMMLILRLGDMLALRAHIKGITKGGDRRRQAMDYSNIKEDYSISQTEMAELLEKHHIQPDLLDAFTINIDKFRTAIQNAESYDNPMYEQPIVLHNGKYYFLLISNQSDALRRFILNIADITGCLQHLMMIHHDIEWGHVLQVCESMKWELTDIKIPDLPANSKECVCQIDANWLGYVHFCYDNSDDVRNDMAPMMDISNRIKEAQDYISKKTDKMRLFIIVLSSTMGEMGGAMGTGADDNPILMMSVHPFVLLSKAEQWEKLDLLYFAECYRAHKDQFIPMLSMLDIYSIYKRYHCSFYMSDKPRPTIITTDVDCGYELIQDSKIEANSHAASFIWQGQEVRVQVVKDSKYFPMYKTVHPSLPYLACVENSKYPIWVSCKQTNPQAMHIADTYGLAILYWMYRINDATYGAGIEPSKPIEISLEFDEDVMKPMLQKEIKLSEELPYEFVCTDTGLLMKIHLNGLIMMQNADNSGERKMMTDLLNMLLGDSRGQLLVDKYMPQDKGKMILLYQTDAATIANRTELLRPKMIQESLKQQLLDMLPIWMDAQGYGFKGRITDKASKEEALRHMVDVLLTKLSEYVKQFEYKSLLHYAIWNYESLVWKREDKKMLDAARAYCFGIDEQMREENTREEQRLTEAGLSLRCLIEYLAAQPHEGGARQAGNYELDHMMVIMGEIISCGEFCDAIHLDVSDQVVECLPSGRYGIYKDEFSNVVAAFQTAYGEDMLAGHMLSFGERFEKKSQPKEKDDDLYPTLDEMDAAFEADWGITYQDIVKVCTSMSQTCVNSGKGALQMLETEVIEEVTRLSGILKGTIEMVIRRLSLEARDAYLQAPEGYKNLEVMPWGYNREFSFTRRFIVREKDKDGGVYLTFGLRNAIASYKQLTYLLMQGQLNAGNGEIKTLVGRFSEIKGKLFNNQVRDYLKEHTNYNVRCDVPIKNDHPFYADKDYGDIDVLAFDKKSGIAYNIECKDAVMAKNIRQMKTEIDKFLGRDETDIKAWVIKHHGRHQWLNQHKQELATYLHVEKVNEVKSVVITSAELPVAYLRKSDSPLPIKSYYKLERVGGDLERLFEQEYS